MIMTGIASMGIFIKKERWKKILKNGLLLIVILLPIGMHSFGSFPPYFQILNIVYIFFFLFIFLEVLRFLIKPGYINTDLISAAACGYFLVLEVSVFLLQYCFIADKSSFEGLNGSDQASVFMDLVYFCSITMASVGYGDIAPSTAQTKLIVSILGIAGQFYTVVLFGIIVSKLTGKHEAEEREKE